MSVKIKFDLPWVIVLFLATVALLWSAWVLFIENISPIPLTVLIVIVASCVVFVIYFLKPVATKGAIKATGSDSTLGQSGYKLPERESSGTVKAAGFKPIPKPDMFVQAHKVFEPQPISEDFDERYAEVSGAPSVETEAPEFDKYYENESIFERNERLKKAYYAESVGNVQDEIKPEMRVKHSAQVISRGVDDTKHTHLENASPAPATQYEPTDEDYARLRGLLSGRAPKIPLGAQKGEDGSGATPSREETTQEKTRGAGCSTDNSTSDHRPAPHSSDVEQINYSQVGEPTYGSRYYEQFFEEEKPENEIIKIKYMTVGGLGKFNSLRSKYLNSLGKKPNLLGVNIKIKKSSSVASSSKEFETDEDKRLHNRIEELKREGLKDKSPPGRMV